MSLAKFLQNWLTSGNFSFDPIMLETKEFLFWANHVGESHNLSFGEIMLGNSPDSLFWANHVGKIQNISFGQTTLNNTQNPSFRANHVGMISRIAHFRHVTLGSWLSPHGARTEHRNARGRQNWGNVRMRKSCAADFWSHRACVFRFKRGINMVWCRFFRF